MSRYINSRGRKWIVAGAICTTLLIAVAVFERAGGTKPFPYHDSFANNRATEWVPWGGTWQINDQAVYNRSDERGAKLVSGSADWADYQLTADLKMIGHGGDVGVIVRLRDEERGVDSYKGYYVGLRSADSALIIGRADHGWMEGRPTPMLGGVGKGIWYRLRIVALGCRIGAEAANIETGQTSWAAFSDEPCIARGKIGLRSMATGGAWKNVSVTATNAKAWEDIRAHTEFLEQPNYPNREAQYSHMREQYFGTTYLPGRNYQSDTAPAQGEDGLDGSSPQIVAIEDIPTTPLQDEVSTIRGVVTLTSPVYIQDASGSIAVHLATPVELNLGDEVEMSGRRTDSGFTPQFMTNSVRLLWDRTLVVPVSITATQAASGAFNGTLVELRGKLQSKSVDQNGVIKLEMYDSDQIFNAFVRGGLSMQTYDGLEPGSDLAIRGVCTVAPSSEPSEVAFTVLMRDIDDVQVLTGPPWWNGRQLIRLAFLSGVLIACGVYLFIRLERWKMHAIINERERLAHDMHDTLAQSFAGVGFHLQGLCNSVKFGTTDRPDLIEMLQRACDMVSHSHREASACVAALHPDADEGGDFLVALNRCAREMLDSDHRDSNTLPVHFTREGVPRPISPPIRDALFHIGREAITNMLRHSQATEMELLLCYQPKGIILQIKDNGVGFLKTAETEGFGIRTMQRRSAKARVQMAITSAPGEGTVIIVRAPYGIGPRAIDWVRSLRMRIPHRAPL